MIILKHQDTQSSRVAVSMIKEIQEVTDLNKRQIASLCKISSRTLYRICSGRVINPSDKTFQRLFELYCLFCCVPHHKTLLYLLDRAVSKNKVKN